MFCGLWNASSALPLLCTHYQNRIFENSKIITKNI